jgi:hypothetical protein
MLSGCNNGKITIFNLLGQIVFESQILNNETIIETNLQKGIYQYDVQFFGNEKSSGKLLIE